MASRASWWALSIFVVAACSSTGQETQSTASGSGGPGGPGGAAGHGGSGGAVAPAGSGGNTGGAAASGGAGGLAPSDGGPEDASDGATFDCAVEGVPGYCIDTVDCAAMPDHALTPGHCPGAANIECCTPYGTALCDPTIVPHPNDGKTTEAPGEGGCPSGMLRVTNFCIDKFEASLVDGTTGESWSPYFNPGTAAMIAVSVQGVVPQGHIDEIQAGDACTNAGKRLCLDTEWLRACQGPDDLTYPYGNTDELGVCNDHRAEHPAVEYYGTSASWIYSELDNACLSQLPDGLDLTGSLPGCVTAEGAHDMMGNLHEWTADPAGTFRGGYYVDTVLNGPGCLYETTAHDAGYWDYSTGFRCCADP